MLLDDSKVYKRFGRHPEYGKALPFLPKEKVTVGVRWSLPKKNYVPDDDVLVTPTVSLTKIKPGLWRVACMKKHWTRTEAWLIEYCR